MDNGCDNNRKDQNQFPRKIFQRCLPFLAVFYKRAGGAKTVRFRCQSGPAHGSAI
jgi:hypothetical protein